MSPICLLFNPIPVGWVSYSESEQPEKNGIIAAKLVHIYLNIFLISNKAQNLLKIKKHYSYKDFCLYLFL